MSALFTDADADRIMREARAALERAQELRRLREAARLTLRIPTPEGGLFDECRQQPELF